MINLDTISNELFNKIRGRFPSVTVGNESAEITNDVKEARFFEFDFVPGKKVSINLDKDSLTIMYSKNLFSEGEDVLKNKWFDFLKEVRAFSKKRMLNFDTRDITKSNLDKRDYEYLSTEKQMSESKLYGTSRTSFQNIGSARMVVKHSAPINQESATGRNTSIAGIYIESNEGERFKYPFKHLNGARAMAQHVSEGGKPYDDFGKHVTGLSEELNKLRKFKTYMNRSSVMAEGLSGYMDVVNDRLNTVKKTIENIQKPSKYKEMTENFTSSVLEDVPEDIATDWTAQLTIKQFNEELKDVFPYVYKLVSEANKIQELGPDELLGEGTGKHLCDECEGKGCKECDNTGFDKSSMKGKEKTEAMGSEYHCKDCGDTMHNPTTNCEHDVHDENGEHWVDDNGNGIHDADEGLDPDESFETHLDSIISNSKHEEEPNVELGFDEEQAFEDFKMAAADCASKGQKEFEYPEGSGKMHKCTMNKATADKILADSDSAPDSEIEQKNDIELDEYVKSMYDYVENSFPKGETAVITSVQKKYGDNAVGEAQKVMVELLKGQDDEMTRIQQLAGV